MTAGRTLAGLRRVAAGLALTLFFHAPLASAQARSPATFDVAGVRLGMTVDEAAAALKAFDPGFTVSKRYFTTGGLPFNAEGVPMDQIPLSDRPMAFFGSLYAIKGAPTRVCRDLPPGSSAPQCIENRSDNEQVVKVWFSHVLGQERVMMIQRTMTFYKDPKPAIATLKQDVFAKYGNQFTYDSRVGWETISWLFDARGQLMSAATARRKNIENAPGMPRVVRPGDGISLNVAFRSSPVTDQIAEELTVTLDDGNALYKSVEEIKAAYEAMKARANAAAVGRARGQPQTKF